jgi:hypothetical protein
MPVRSDLVERSGDLKAILVEFAEARRFARDRKKALDQYLPGGVAESEAELANAIDQFLLRYKLPDGRTVVEVFVDEYLDLTDEERALLLGWRDVVEGVFQVDRRDGNALVLTNLIDELEYRVHSNMGPAALDRMKKGSFLITRLVPIEDEWLLSGISGIYPASFRNDVYRAAAELAAQSPTLAFRNPDKVEQGWELQRKDRQSFVDFFGTDLVVLPGREVVERMRAYTHYRTHDMLDESGRSAAERSRELYGSEPAELDLQLPSYLTEAETVGVIYDEIEGMVFLRSFGLLEEAFADPETMSDSRHRDAVLTYLEDSSIPPVALRRLAERSPERASQVFARLLKRPEFSWDRDGEALLRQHKAEHFERPPLPSTAPLSSRLAQAKLRRPASSTTAARRRQPSKRPKRRAKRR